MTCKCCGKDGHHVSDPECLMKSPPEVSESIDTFRGGKYQLSNLHKCPEGYVITEGAKVFPSSKHKYQFSKLKAHDKMEEAFELLYEPDPFKVMQKLKEILPESEITTEWKASTISEMSEANFLKFKSCSHTREGLLSSKITIAEATADHFWGTGLTLEQTVQCLPEFWPGENHMGCVLTDLWLKFQHENERNYVDTVKQKADSPLLPKNSKKSGYR